MKTMRIVAMVCMSAASMHEIDISFYIILQRLITSLPVVVLVAQWLLFALVMFSCITVFVPLAFLVCLRWYMADSTPVEIECVFCSSYDKRFIDMLVKVLFDGIVLSKLKRIYFRRENGQSDLVQVQQAVNSVVRPRRSVVVLTRNLIEDFHAKRIGSDTVNTVQMNGKYFILQEYSILLYRYSCGSCAIE